MGWCHEFGPQLREDCAHPMTAASSSCQCTACGFTCTGRFPGCAQVWAHAGSAPVVVVVPPSVGDGQPLGDVRHALSSIRAEIEQLRATEAAPEPPPVREETVVLPSYDDLLDVTTHRRRGGRWWRRHRAQHLER